METFSALLAFLCREFTGNKGQWRGALMFSLISKQPIRWWFETPSRSLWRHSNADFTMLSALPHAENVIFYYSNAPNQEWTFIECILRSKPTSEPTDVLVSRAPHDTTKWHRTQYQKRPKQLQIVSFKLLPLGGRHPAFHALCVIGCYSKRKLLLWRVYLSFSTGVNPRCVFNIAYLFLDCWINHCRTSIKFIWINITM